PATAHALLAPPAPRPPPPSPLFPYTTLFRSRRRLRVESDADQVARLVHLDRVPRPEAAEECGREPPEARRPNGERGRPVDGRPRSEEHTSELQSRFDLVCRLLLEKKKQDGLD